MILVPNRLLPLSGSKLLICFLLIGFLSSCDLFRKVQTDDPVGNDKTGQNDTDVLDPIEGSIVYNPQTGKYDTVKVLQEKMDTIQWKNNAGKSTPPPITSDGKYVDDSGGPAVDGAAYDTKLFSSYNVALILPFLSNRFTEGDNATPENSDWALNFYGGAKMALDVLSAEGVSLKLDVIDTEASEQTTRNLLSSNEAIQNAHLILGPYRKNNVKQVATFAQQNNTTFVSPYSASSSITNKNPNYVQVNPTLDTHLEAIMKHARQKYDPSQITLVVQNKSGEIKRLQTLQDINAEIEGATDLPRLQEYIVEETSADFKDMKVTNLLRAGETTVFIVPSFSNEVFISEFLRKVYIQAQTRQVVVYGMPQWRDFTNVDYDYFETLNVHISSSNFVDPFSTEIQEFKRQFFDLYGTAPKDEAFLGYDVALYFGRMLKKNGTRFQFFLDQNPGEGYLETEFHFEPVVNTPTSGTDNFNINRIERFENKYVNILKFDDYYFQLAE